MLGNCGTGKTHQPPLGGCVLKPLRQGSNTAAHIQPPLGGCVLKQAARIAPRQQLASRL